MRTHRSTSRYPSPAAVVAVLLTSLLSGALPGSSLLAQTNTSMQTTASIGLELDAERVAALFAGSSSVSAADLLSEALTLSTTDAPGGDMVLIAYRMRDAQPVAEFRSDPFSAADGLLGPRGVVPGADFYGGLAVEQDGISTTTAASPASDGIADPSGFVARNALGGPADRFGREVMYAIVVPADPGLQAETTASGLVLYGDDVITLETGSGGGGAAGEPADAAEVLRRFAASEQRCKGWVKDYTVYQRTPEGMVVPQYFKAYQGGPECRAVPMTEYLDSLYVHAGADPPRWPAEMEMGYDMLGQGLEEGLAQEGFPLPVSMLTDPLADFSREASEVEPGELMVDDVEDRVADRGEFFRRARLVGKETMNGRPAYHVRADSLHHFLGSAGGSSWWLSEANAWFDVQRDVMLRLRFDVTASGGDASGREIVIEALHENHRAFDGASRVMWFPTRRVMRITGLTETMSEEEKAKIEKVKADIEHLRGEMDAMPSAMRGMLEKQIARLEKMSGEGEGPSLTEAVIDILHVAVNEGAPYPGGVGRFRVAGGAFPGMGHAKWLPLHTTNFYVPHEIGMTGKNPAVNVAGWISFKGETLEEVGSGAVLPGLFLVRGTVEGGYDEGDVQVHIGPEEALLVVHRLTLTEATGEINSDNAWATFQMGHMPCSRQSRALGIEWFEMDPSPLIWGDPGPLDSVEDWEEDVIDQVQEEAEEIVDDPELLRRCRGVGNDM